MHYHHNVVGKGLLSTIISKSKSKSLILKSFKGNLHHKQSEGNLHHELALQICPKVSVLVFQTPSKKVGGGRTPGPVIPPHKVSISADGDLASKLAQLAVEAESIKQKMSDGRLPSSSR